MLEPQDRTSPQLAVTSFPIGLQMPCQCGFFTPVTACTIRRVTSQPNAFQAQVRLSPFPDFVIYHFHSHGTRRLSGSPSLVPFHLILSCILFIPLCNYPIHSHPIPYVLLLIQLCIFNDTIRIGAFHRSPLHPFTPELTTATQLRAFAQAKVVLVDSFNLRASGYPHNTHPRLKGNQTRRPS